MKGTGRVMALSAKGRPLKRYLTPPSPHRHAYGKELKPTNLEAAPGGEGGTVLCFWGNATWSRTQLLGEIARGHWGLCKGLRHAPLLHPPPPHGLTRRGTQGSVQEITTPATARWAGLQGRLAFAPVTEMTEAPMAQAPMPCPSFTHPSAALFVEDFMREAQQQMASHATAARRGSLSHDVPNAAGQEGTAGGGVGGGTT